MPDPGTDLRYLAARLRAAGTEGKGLRNALTTAIADAVKPLASEIGSAGNLDAHLPDRYAAVLGADLTVSVRKSLGADPRVSVVAKAREHKRKVALFDRGLINHPVYAQGTRKKWRWKNGQTGGMKAGFFSGPAEAAAPGIRDKVTKALADTARQVARG